MTLDLQALDSAMKEYYDDAMYQELVYKSNPFFALIRKNEGFVGKKMPIPNKFSDGGGVASQFSVAQQQSLSTSPQFSDFELTHSQLFSLAQVDGLVYEISKTSKGAFIDAATAAMDSAINRLTRQVAIQMFRSGAGELGQVAVAPTNSAGTFEIQFKSAEDATNIDVGHTIQIFQNLSGGSARTSDGAQNTFKIVKVDVISGVITVEGDKDGSSTIAPDDYIFLQGTRGGQLVGLAGWLPLTAPSSTPFFSVDRSVDAVKLGGVRHDGRNQPLDEALIDGMKKVGRLGGKPDVCIMSFEKYAELIKILGSKVIYKDAKVGELSFRAVELISPRGTIECIADMSCPSDRCYLLQTSSWSLCTAGKAINLINADGNTWLRQASADGLEARVAFRGNLACNAPGHNCVIRLA